MSVSSSLSQDGISQDGTAMSQDGTANTGSLLSRCNPTARLAAMALMTTPLLISVDIVSASVALGLEIIGAIILGIPLGRLARRAIPVAAFAPITGLSMLLYGKPEGREYASFLFAHITDNSIHLAAAITVRVLAVGLPAVALTVDLDPTEMGDGLAQVWRFPARFVVGAVAGVRMISLFQHDYLALQRARRARGMSDTGRIRRALTVFFGLLVLALRRGGKLATAMEARGFGDPKRPRTWARPSRLYRRDYALMIGSFVFGCLAIAAAWWTGDIHWWGA